MGIFADWAQNYWDLGIQPVPVEPNSKICRVKNSDKHFFNDFMAINDLEKWSKSHGHWHLGIALGQVSGLIGIDFDYEGFEDSKYIESSIIGAIPITPLIKKGKKGWTRFYRYTQGIGTKHIKRKDTNKTMVDVLSNGSITVMPPSPHKDDGHTYHWVTDDNFETVEVSELPFITNADIDRLYEIADSDHNKITIVELNKSTRHDRLFSFILKESNKVDNLHDLAQATVNFDFMIHKDDEKGPYFEDKKYNMGKQPIEAALTFCSRICDWKQKKKREEGVDWSIGQSTESYWIETDKGFKRSDRYVDFARFFTNKIPETRLDLFSKVAYTKVRNEWTPTENLIERLQSYSVAVGLQRTLIQQHLNRWCYERAPQLLIDIPKSNASGEIEKMVNHLTFGNISQTAAVELFKEWLAGIFVRIKEPWIQNHFVILKGPQGLGKDTWISHLLKGFGPYFNEVVVSRDKRENYMTLSGLAVGFIPEFDETNKVEVGILKSMVTVREATLRLPYARRAERFDFRHSLISSSNFNHLLRDSSGNRRYMIFDVEKIDFNYLNEVDPIKLISEAYHLAKNGYKASEGSRYIMNLYIESQTPDDTEEFILEECAEIISKYSTLGRLAKWSLIGEEIGNVAKRYGMGVRKIQTMMKSKGWYRRTSENRYYLVD